MPIQYEHAPLRVRCTMLRKHPPVDPVLSCLSCFRKPSVLGVCQVVSHSPDPGIVWPSTRFRPNLWRWFKEDMASIRRLIHSGYMAKQREATGFDNRGKWRLLSGMADIFIPHEIRPFEAKDSSQAPLVQRVNSKYVRFVDCPTFRCVQHDGRIYVLYKWSLVEVAMHECHRRWSSLRACI